MTEPLRGDIVVLIPLAPGELVLSTERGDMHLSVERTDAGGNKCK